MSKYYWVNVTASGNAMNGPWHMPVLEKTFQTIDDAKKQIWELHKNFGLIDAWITDSDHNPVWVHSFVNITSDMESRHKKPDWLHCDNKNGLDDNNNSRGDFFE